MLLEDAVKILNRNNHRENDWIAKFDVTGNYALGRYGLHDIFSEFEAIAIAEKYIREENN